MQTIQSLFIREYRYLQATNIFIFLYILFEIEILYNRYLNENEKMIRFLDTDSINIVCYIYLLFNW